MEQIEEQSGPDHENWSRSSYSCYIKSIPGRAQKRITPARNLLCYYLEGWLWARLRSPGDSKLDGYIRRASPDVRPSPKDSLPANLERLSMTKDL